MHGLRAVKQLSLGSGPDPCLLFSALFIVPCLEFLPFFHIEFFSLLIVENALYLIGGIIR